MGSRIDTLSLSFFNLSTFLSFFLSFSFSRNFFMLCTHRHLSRAFRSIVIVWEDEVSRRDGPAQSVSGRGQTLPFFLCFHVCCVRVFPYHNISLIALPFALSHCRVIAGLR